MYFPVGDATFYAEQHGGGPDVVLLHGNGLTSARVWRFVVPALADRYRVLIYDLRGCGRSTGAAEDQSVGRHSADLLAVLDHFGIRQAHLLGFSFTGLVVQRFALDHPDRLRSLTLAATGMGVAPKYHSQYEERARLVETHGMAPYLDTAMSITFTPDFFTSKDDVAAWYRQQFLSDNPALYAARVRQVPKTDFSDRVSSIRCPVLVIDGAEDAHPLAGGEAGKAAREMHRLIPGSQLVLVPNARHYPQLEQPELFAKALLTFFDGIE